MSGEVAALLRRNAASALREGNLEEAQILITRLREEDPLAVETRGLELEYLLRAGELTAAETLAGQLLKQFPDSPRIHYLGGRIAYKLKNYAAAEERLRESHRLHHSPWTLHMRGKALVQMGRFDEALPILESLLEENVPCRLDLAWLYERREEYDAALRHVEAFLRTHPEDEFARAQERRLRARLSGPDDLIEEVETLQELDEKIPDEWVPEYCEALLRRGQRDRLQSFLAERGAAFSTRLTVGVAWSCYRLQAYDLATDLFLMVFGENRGNVKYLAALEKAADRAGRLADLARVLKAHAGEEPKLYGRLRSVRRRMEGPQAK